MENKDTTDSLLYASFNDDASRLAIGTHQGFNVYKLHGNEVVLKYSLESGDGCRIVETYKSFILMVGIDEEDNNGFTSRHFRVWSGKDKCVIHEKVLDTSITACRINEQYYIISLESSVYVFSMALLESEIPMLSADTYPGLGHVVALQDHHIAYVSREGSIIVKDILQEVDLNLNLPTPFEISSLKFSNDLSSLAVVGDEGKSMVIFDLTGAKIPFRQYLRGKYPKNVHIPCFSACTRYIGLSSGSTAHIFVLKSNNAETSIRRLISTLFQALNPFSSNTERALVKIRLDDPGDTLLSFKPSTNEDQIELVMIKTSGLLLQCRIDMNEKDPEPKDWVRLNLFD